MTQAAEDSFDLEVLSSLGFGPDAALVREPKLFVDRAFLSSVLIELEDEFDTEGARRALFQIGLLCGLRDALRITQAEFQSEGAGRPAEFAEATSLVIHLGTPRCTSEDDPTPGQISIPGSWPERHEAEARLARLGPEHTPSCVLSAGYTSGWLSGTLDTDILALEQECAASGAEHCAFVARELSAWRDAQEPRALGMARGVDFASLRDLTARALANPPPSYDADVRPEAVDDGTFDPGAPIVHVWGPVMVLPFTGIDEALETVGMLGSDPGTSEIRAVVVHLRDFTLDADFGAAALEHVLDSIESWGAEAILTGVSMISESVVAQIERSHLIVRKDLPEAIAAAFQIAEVQRHLL